MTVLQPFLSDSIVTARSSSSGKVIFLQACVKNSVHGGGGGSLPRRGVVCLVGVCL